MHITSYKSNANFTNLADIPLKQQHEKHQICSLSVSAKNGLWAGLCACVF